MPDFRTENILDKSSLKILLADDNMLNQRLLSVNLKRMGYSVDCVSNGHEAVDAYKAHPYDVILMDVMMPFMDGCQAAEQIRIHEQAEGLAKSVILSLSSAGVDTDIERCTQCGMDGSLPKPFSVEEFDNILAKYIKA